MSRDDLRDHVGDMIAALQRAREFTGGMTLAEFAGRNGASHQNWAIWHLLQILWLARFPWHAFPLFPFPSVGGRWLLLAPFSCSGLYNPGKDRR